MRAGAIISNRLLPIALIAALLGGVGCDSTQPSDEGTLVVEAFLDAGRPLPRVRVSTTVGLDKPASDRSSAITDARVLLTLSGRQIQYVHSPQEPGYYHATASSSDTVTPGAAYFLDVTAGSKTAEASGTVPPRLNIENFSIEVPESPVAAVFVDSLDIGLDSLDLGLDARQGYIYPVEVSVDWNSPDGEFNGAEYWIQARLDPLVGFSSSIVDFFLLSEQIFRERDAVVVQTPGLPDRRSWSGVYAVSVDDENDPLPEHTLRLSLLRGDDEFARFATSKGDPERREPISNVRGGIGFVGAVSVDSLSMIIEADRQ